MYLMIQPMLVPNIWGSRYCPPVSILPYCSQSLSLSLSPPLALLKFLNSYSEINAQRDHCDLV